MIFSSSLKGTLIRYWESKGFISFIPFLLELNFYKSELFSRRIQKTELELILQTTSFMQGTLAMSSPKITIRDWDPLIEDHNKDDLLVCKTFVLRRQAATSLVKSFLTFTTIGVATLYSIRKLSATLLNCVQNSFGKGKLTQAIELEPIGNPYASLSCWNIRISFLELNMHAQAPLVHVFTRWFSIDCMGSRLYT